MAKPKHGSSSQSGHDFQPHGFGSGSGSGHDSRPPHFGSGSGSGPDFRPPHSGSGSGSGSGFDEPNEDKSHCPVFGKCFLKHAKEYKAIMQDTKRCHKVADEVYDCVSQQSPEDLCSKSCKGISLLATKSVGPSLTHSHCPKHRDCPNLADDLPSKKDMVKFFSDREYCENGKALAYVKEKRREIENFEGDLIQCHPADSIHAEVFDVLEVVVEARCKGCTFPGINPKTVTHIKPGSFCEMKQAMKDQIDRIIKALSQDEKCEAITNNKHRLDAVLRKTLGVWCSAEKERK